MNTDNSFINFVLEQQFNLLKPIPRILWVATPLLLLSLLFAIPRLELIAVALLLGLLFLAAGVAADYFPRVNTNLLVIVVILVFAVTLDLLTDSAVALIQLTTMTFMVFSVGLVIAVRWIRAVTRPQRDPDYVRPSLAAFVFRLIYPAYSRDLDMDAPARDQIIRILKNRKGAEDLATVYLEVDKGVSQFQGGKPATLTEVFELAENSNLELSQQLSKRLFA